MGSSKPRPRVLNTFAPRRHFPPGGYEWFETRGGDELVAIAQVGTVSRLMCDQPAAVISLLSSIEVIVVV